MNVNIKKYHMLLCITYDFNKYLCSQFYNLFIALLIFRVDGTKIKIFCELFEIEIPWSIWFR